MKFHLLFLQLILSPSKPYHNKGIDNSYANYPPIGFVEFLNFFNKSMQKYFSFVIHCLFFNHNPLTILTSTFTF